MDKVYFRLFAWIVFISLSVSVFFCVYNPTVEIGDMPHMSHESTLFSHFDHIHLLTTAVFSTLVLIIVLCALWIIESLLVDLSSFYKPVFLQYAKPPDDRYRLSISYGDEGRGPPVD